MKNTAKIIFIFSILVLGILSCKKDKENPIEEIQTPNISLDKSAKLDLGNDINADFFIQIVDESNQPLYGVKIEIGSKTGITDANGILLLKNAYTKEKLAYITAKKSGYFLGSRSLIADAKDINNIKIMMLELDIVDQVKSGEIKTVTLAEGASIEFKGNYTDASGNIYSGNVDVAFKHLPAFAENTSDQMPGMLYAQNNSAESGFLETYGMIAVELFGESGQELQISEGSNATISLPVNTAQMSLAPQTIPLWHFDEVAGYWIEEGEANLVDGKYVGDVTHFSFWNCDDFRADAVLKGEIKDSNGNPIPNIIVKIITPNASISGRAGSNGKFSTYIPANEIIKIEIIDRCGNILISWTGGPYSVNSTTPIIIQNSTPNPNTINIIGSLYDCNNKLVTNGYFMIKINTRDYFFPLINGSINTTIRDCNFTGNITVNGYDKTNLQQTGSTSVAISKPTTNIGNLIACNAITEYITYTIDSNSPINYINSLRCGVETRINSSPGILMTGNDQSGGYFSLATDGLVIGPYIFLDTDPNTPDGEMYISSGISHSPLPNITINLNTFGPVGTLIKADFSGSYQDSSAVSHTISGSAHIKRLY